MIVLVAGNTPTAQTVARELWLRGFDASEAESPGIGVTLEALEIADAVVVDLENNDFPGAHVIQRLKDADARMPVIAIGPDHKAAAAYLAGADVILAPGVDVTALAGELDRLARESVVLGG